MAEEGIRARVIEPDGREVVLRDEQWNHVRSEHPQMARYERAIMETITHPDERTSDPRPGRERYFGYRKGPREWLRVVVDFNDDPGWVVTAFGHDQEPT